MSAPTVAAGAAGHQTYRRLALTATSTWARVLAVAFVLALVPRLVGIQLVTTADEGHWMQRTLRFGAALASGDQGGTYQRGHPGVMVMWVGTLGIGSELASSFTSEQLASSRELESAPRYLEAFGRARVAVALSVALVTAITAWLSIRLLGPAAGLAGAALLVLDPYYVGMTRLLHPDALLAPLAVCSVLAIILYYRDGGGTYLVLSAVAAGLAALTKSPALVIAAYLPLLALFGARQTDPRFRLLTAALWALVAGTVYIVLWPAMWGDPVGQVGQVIGFVLSTGLRPHDSANFFFGPTLEDPGPAFYPVSIALRLGPIATAGLLAALVIPRGEARTRLLWLAAFAALFLAALTVGGKKFDRYALPAIAALDLFAGACVWLAAREVGRWGQPAALAAFGVQAAILAWSYPYPVTAYNPLLGGHQTALRAIMVGWGEGLEQAAAYLNTQPAANELVVATNYEHAFRPRFVGQTIPIGALEQVQPDEDPPADYAILLRKAAQTDQYPEIVRRALQREPARFVANINGRPYAWVVRLRQQEAGRIAPTAPPVGVKEKREDS